MAHLIVHLTDAHLDAESAAFVDRAEAIASAALSPMVAVTSIDLVFSGDLANKTAPADFVFAKDLIQRLCRRLSERTGIDPSIILVAGNHDCDFSGDQSIRDALLGVARSRPAEISGPISDQLASPLAGFYSLQLELNQKIEVKNNWLSILTNEDVGLRYVLINSAVMSVKREDPGKLFVPIPEIEARDDLRTIYVMHHPYGWLMPDNARELAQHAAMLGDLFLMGHEHELWAQQVSDLYDETAITYLRGHVLRESTDDLNSAFQTIHLDRDKGFQPRSYKWKGGEYGAWFQKSKEDYLAWPQQGGRGKNFAVRAGPQESKLSRS